MMKIFYESGNDSFVIVWTL